MSLKNLQTKTRYSDEELNEFKSIIAQKMERAQQMEAQLTEQMKDTQSNFADNDSDWLDDASSQSDLEMLHTMVHRQRKHIKDLENALIRIRNKNYGICMVTGVLIDKARLMVVPTTTKSLKAKTGTATPSIIHPRTTSNISTKKQASRIISRVVKKANPTVIKGEHKDDYEDDDDESLDIEMMNIDFDAGEE